ncbi:glycosyltransferase family 4 protein [Nocardioides massiliensis]|uniref:glycosyltransferase family 4 protein n=1 Tax=Nocardioides massiliensis TaxID=1325935 RepID=UPI0024844D11|nr:glycosyltransferase family 4 protein [Nocardioides massiliensis]
MPFIVLARLLGVRVIVQIHGSHLDGLLGRSPVSQRWARLGLRAAAVVVVLDSATEERLEELAGRKISRLPNFMQTRSRLEAPRVHAERLLYVGRVAHDKGSGVLLEIGRLLRGGERLTVAGPLDPAIEASFARDAAQLGIHVTGQLAPKEVEDLLRTADVLVLPSFHEGFPMVVLEAMSVGLPVVASDVGACREMLVDGPETAAGVVLPSPSRTSPQEFARATIEILRTGGLSRLYGGQERVDSRYSPSAVISQMRQLGRAGGSK